MSDWKSKIPNLDEVISMTTKLAKDIKTSVTELYHEYQEKHPSSPKDEAKVEETKEDKSEEKPAVSEVDKEPKKNNPEKKKKDSEA